MSLPFTVVVLCSVGVGRAFNFNVEVRDSNYGGENNNLPQSDSRGSEDTSSRWSQAKAVEGTPSVLTSPE